jgi:tetratricopeptide (TPR) repeat protein
VIYEAIGHCFHRLNNFAQARFHYRKASHMNPEDSKLQYKIAVTYISEQQYDSAVKHLDNAMRIHRNVPEYNLAMGQCKMEQEKYKEAIQYFSVVVRNKAKSVAGWEALIRCLYKAGFIDEACDQSVAALAATDQKPVFYFYYSAALFAGGKTKEGMLQLEKGMSVAPKLVKKLVEIAPAILQKNQVVDLIARYKKGRKI